MTGKKLLQKETRRLEGRGRGDAEERRDPGQLQAGGNPARIPEKLSKTLMPTANTQEEERKLRGTTEEIRRKR